MATATLNELALSPTGATEADQKKVEIKLNEMLPAGTFTVLLRTASAGDFRARTSGTAVYTVKIIVTHEGRTTVLADKERFLNAGFVVASDGGLSLHISEN